MVASPEPLEVLDAPAVRALVDAGYVVVGQRRRRHPDRRREDGALRGVEAVIDKDLGAALLARTVAADVLVIATDVPHAVLRFGTPEAEPLGEVTVGRMRGTSPRRPLRERLDGAEGRGRLPVRRAGRPARRHHRPRPDRRRRRGPGRHRRRTRLKPKHHRKEAAMPSAIEVRKVPIHSVADASELAKLIDDGVMEADRVIAIIGKTEGNGGVNDYTRIIADRAFREVLVDKGARPGRRSSRSRSCGPAAPTA